MTTKPADPLGFFGVPADYAPNSDDYQPNDVGGFFDETLQPDLVFHRIPIRGVLCSHFKQVTTMGKFYGFFLQNLTNVHILHYSNIQASANNYANFFPQIV